MGFLKPPQSQFVPQAMQTLIPPTPPMAPDPPPIFGSQAQKKPSGAQSGAVPTFMGGTGGALQPTSQNKGSKTLLGM